jgi:hypothetical protein
MDAYLDIQKRLPQRDVPGVVRTAVESDLPWINVLYRDNRRLLGYFPKGAMEGSLADGRILVYERGGEILGYLLWGGTATHSKIFHLVIEQQSRRKLHGVRALLGAFLASRPLTSRLVSLRCRIDNVATLFWGAVGFVPVSFEASVGSGLRPIIRWVLPLHVGIAGQKTVKAIEAWQMVLARGGGKGVREAIKLCWGVESRVLYPLGEWLSLPAMLEHQLACEQADTPLLGGSTTSDSSLSPHSVSRKPLISTGGNLAGPDATIVMDSFLRSGSQ